MRARWIFILIACIAAGCDNQDKAWEMAQRDDDPTSYLEFLAKYPDGQFADAARQRIEALKEINAWERAEFRDNEAGYVAFIEKFPASEYAAEAQGRVDGLQIDSRWSVVQDADSTEVVEAFLRDYPDAPQAAEARELLSTLAAVATAEAPAERAGDFRLQLGAFRTAKSADTELRRIVGLFPDTLLGPVRIETPSEGTANRRFLLKSVPMTREEANAACASLQRFRQTCLVINN